MPNKALFIGDDMDFICASLWYVGNITIIDFLVAERNQTDAHNRIDNIFGKWHPIHIHNMLCQGIIFALLVGAHALTIFEYFRMD